MHDDAIERTRRSWNIATRNHNAHKGDQAARLRDGHELLFDEELTLLGDVAAKRLVHLQCNSGQDSLCLARRGAKVTGVDYSDEAIAFARDLSRDSGIAAEFEHAEVVSWMHKTKARFDLAFCSYGVTGWLPDLRAWAAGVHRILAPSGRLVYVEFHPIVWSFGAEFTLAGDDYFIRTPIVAPVEDYVAAAGTALAAERDDAIAGRNDEPAVSWQWTLADVVDAIVGAGLELEHLREYPHANGCRVVAGLEPEPGTRRWIWPAGVARLPLMYGISARRPSG